MRARARARGGLWPCGVCTDVCLTHAPRTDLVGGVRRAFVRIIDSDLAKLLVNWFLEAVNDNKMAFIKSSLEVRPRLLCPAVAVGCRTRLTQAGP
jgi:hypothetical protein